MEPDLIAAIVGILGAGAAYIKAHAENTEIVKSRESTKVERDSRIALLEAKVSEMDKRLEEGNDRFERFEKELKETNGMLRELIGMFKGSHSAVRTFDDVVRREG